VHRKEAHQKLKCLSVKIDAEGVWWHCNHCGWSGGLSGGKKFDAIYEYVDGDGQLLWQKLRYRGAKRFTQRKPNGSGWQWTDVRKGQSSLLYRLPEVNAAIKEGRTIVLVEGEKDANNLWVIGIAATCNPDGAAKPGKSRSGVQNIARNCATPISSSSATMTRQATRIRQRPPDCHTALRGACESSNWRIIGRNARKAATFQIG
jgi:hypothetical protein